MTSILALCYVCAFGLLVGAAATRFDPRPRRLLGTDEVPRSGSGSGRLSRWILLPRAGAVLRERVRSKAENSRLGSAVPDLLDVLAVAVTAGLSPRLALERAPDVLVGPLGDALGDARREVSLGTPWRVALESAGDRTGVVELRRLALTIRRAERLGSPIADRLRDLATEVRAERRAHREERAGRAPVKMLFPLVFLILPAFVMAGVVPALIVATRDLV